MVPPATVRVPAVTLMAEAPVPVTLSANVLTARTVVALLTAIELRFAVLTSRVIVTPAGAMVTSYPAAGEPAGVQLPAVFQVVPALQDFATNTPARPAMPESVRGGCATVVSDGRAAVARERAASSHPPPRAAAPTRLVAAEIWAQVAQARPSRSASAALPAPARQLHSLRSPLGASAAPIAAKSAASSLSVSADQSPAAKLTRPGAPWAMTWMASRPRRPPRAAAIWLAAGRAVSSTTASTPARNERRIVSTSKMEESTKAISQLEGRPEPWLFSLKSTPSPARRTRPGPTTIACGIAHLDGRVRRLPAALSPILLRKNRDFAGDGAQTTPPVSCPRP